MEGEPDRVRPGSSENESNLPPQNKPVQEYFDTLEKWMQSVYVWHCVMVSFPYLVMSNQYFSQTHGQNTGSTFPLNRNAFTLPHGGNQFGFGAGGNAGAFRNRHATSHQQQSVNGVEYQIPPIWKRFVAEFLDFLILFFVKLAVTFIAVDVFNIIDLDKYDLDLLSRTGSINYKTAVEMTAEIVTLEGIHRIVVSIFEVCRHGSLLRNIKNMYICVTDVGIFCSQAFWIRRAQGGQIGGATPGKLIMRIRVVRCDRVTSIEGRPPDVVLVYPATDLGWTRALVRSFVKNLILAVLIPALFALFFLKHNRTGYDILCRTIVVEDRPRQNA